MKYIIFSILITISTATWANKSADLLIVGDSWAKLMCLNNSFDRVFEEKEMQIEVLCAATTEAGSHSKHWNSEKKRKIIKKAFAENPKIKAVVLSAGGNDFFGKWNNSKTEIETAEIVSQIKNELQNNINYFRELSPHVKILISGYDYGNFEKINEIEYIKGYQNTFNRLGRPDTQQLNAAFIELNRMYVQLVRENTDVIFSNHMGISHYYFGTENESVSAKSLPFPGQYPNYEPIFGGDPNQPNSEDALITLSWIDYMDPYHLSRRAYKRLARHMIEYYLISWL